MKTISKVILFCLLFGLVLFSFSGCAGNKAYLTYEDAEISESTYKYWLSTAKSDFISSYSDITDTTECWNRKVTGLDGKSITIGEYVEQYTLQYAKSVVCELQMFKDYDLELDKADTEEIDEYLSEVIYYQYDDSKSKFNDALKKTYGINTDDLRDALIIEKKVEKVENYLFGDNGIIGVSDEDYANFYKKNYVRIFVIVIQTASEYVYNDEGGIVYNDLGLPEIKYYTDEEKEEKRKKADAISERISAGEDFISLCESESELKIEGGKNGFYFSKYDYESLVGKGYDPTILSSVLKQETGKVERYETEGEAIFFVLRTELDDAPYLSSESKSQFADLKDHIVTEKYQKMLEKMWDEIVISDEVYDLKTINVKKGIL